MKILGPLDKIFEAHSSCVSGSEVVKLYIPPNFIPFDRVTRARRFGESDTEWLGS
jgi:hypothetical protein